MIAQAPAPTRPGNRFRFGTPGRPPAICFVALKSYSVLAARSDIPHVGGAEIQQLLIARWLRQHGFRVRFVTLDHGQPDGEDVGGIRVHVAYRADKGVPGLRFFHPRASGLWRAMESADADVYYQRGAGTETGLVANWCRMHRRPFVFSMASDMDCRRDLPLLKSPLERFLYRWGLRNADRVIAQTRCQQESLSKNFGVQSSIVLSGCADPAGGARQDWTRTDDERPRVLWVGRRVWEKRYEWILDVAERCPTIEFDVVGPVLRPESQSLSVEEQTRNLPNVHIHGKVTHNEMPAFYSAATVLCCTSIYEGFPNTFLEAWSRGVPVVATFDPDNVIRCHGTGWTTDTVEGIVNILRNVTRSPEALANAGNAAREYYLAHHTPSACLAKLQRVLSEVIANHYLEFQGDALAPLTHSDAPTPD